MLFFFIGTLCTAAVAQQFEFLENKGQWHPDALFKGELNAGALFLSGSGYRVLQHSKDSYAEALETMSGHHHGAQKPGTLQAISNQSVSWRSHAYEVAFVGANPKVQVEGQKPQPGVTNFFTGNDPEKWVSGLKSYTTVLYRNMYDGIDVRYYTQDGFIKYDIIVQPNAPSERIAVKYDGVNDLQVKDGNLIVKTSVATITEQYPYSYQVVNGVKKTVKCRFEVYDKTVRFKVGDYDRSVPLIIDPTLIFSTFTGSSSDNWGYTATYDAAGNMYAGGTVFGNGYPITLGAFQSRFNGGGNTGENGGFDIGIMKFSPLGNTRVYATYLGGGGNEQPHSLETDPQGNLVIAGRTNSTDYPTTRPFIGPATGSLNWDITITKLNATGTAMVGSVRIGGTRDDGVNIRHKFSGPGGPISLQQNYGDDARSEVIIDGAGNILLASCSQSTDFPTTAGAFQRTLTPGSSNSLGVVQDALLLKFNANLTALQFASFLGGAGDDAAYVLAMGITGDIFVAGGTSSANFPGDKSGTFQPTNAGGLSDGFISRISPDGSTLIKTVFVGTNGTDQVYGLDVDRFGFLYFMGTSTGNFPVRNATFSQASGKQFIAKVSSDLSAYVYSTVFGSGSSTPNISPTAFLVDRCENIYVSGWGGIIGNSSPNFTSAGTIGLSVTPDAIKSSTDGRDFYFFVMQKDATAQLYGSFYGQNDGIAQNSSDHVDGGTSRFDAAGVIYQALCANCGGGQFPTTPGVVGGSNPSGRCNQALVKISFDLSGVRSGVKAGIASVRGDTVGCVPLTITFRDTIELATRYEWNFDDGTPEEFTTTVTNAHTFARVGTYRVRLIAVDSTKCFPRDTSFVIINVREDEAILNARSTKLLPCDASNYRFDNLSIPSPGKPFLPTSFTWIFGDNSPNVVAGSNSVNHTFPGPGTYRVRLALTDTNYCNAPDTFNLDVRVSPNVAARIRTPASGCAPYNAVFNNASLGGTSFLWTFHDGTRSTLVNPTKLYQNPGVYSVKLVAIDSSSCNIIDSTTFTITVNGKPVSLFSYSPNPSQENVITTFANLSTGAVRYKWLFGDGDTLNTVRRDTTVRHQYRQNSTFNACLVAINEFGCADTSCQPITITINPLIDVVSAFTPNGDGVNDRAVVFGYGVAKITFRIYNRIGQMVFESADVRIGWDGKFKGKEQPMDAYGYTLDAEFVNGEKFRKSGSITLVR
ncbi:MAG: PKD domain-containing protein [Bacteroidetes bacterium]|nr:MAG: PKD domain-containing protein [Bacteroidota bacterium]